MRGKKGFTLIEILFVIIVIAILAAIAIMRITTTMATARASTCNANEAIINTQIEQFQLDTAAYPADAAALAALLANTTYFPGGVPVCPDAGTYVYTVPPIARVDCDFAGPPAH